MATAAEIQATFAAAEMEVPATEVAKIAGLLGPTGRLPLAIAHAEHSRNRDGVTELLRYQAALADADEPARVAARKSREADDIEYRSAKNWEEAAEYYGKSRFRELNEQPELAEQFFAKGAAAEKVAAEQDEQAYQLRARAHQIEARIKRSADFARTAATIARAA